MEAPTAEAAQEGGLDTTAPGEGVKDTSNANLLEADPSLMAAVQGQKVEEGAMGAGGGGGGGSSVLFESQVSPGAKAGGDGTEAAEEQEAAGAGKPLGRPAAGDKVTSDTGVTAGEGDKLPVMDQGLPLVQ